MDLDPLALYEYLRSGYCMVIGIVGAIILWNIFGKRE